MIVYISKQRIKLLLKKKTATTGGCVHIHTKSVARSEEVPSGCQQEKSIH